MSLINGIHHVAVKPQKEQFAAVMKFYTEILELPVVRQWGDPEYPCTMLSTGDNSCVEILPVMDGEELPHEGKVAHIALATNEVDECVKRVRAAGYTITMEPTDVELAGMPARVAFCDGAGNEIIEFFCEK